MTSSTIWLGIGLLGQGLFFMRFLVQWIASERSRRSVVPRAFWYFSILGGLTLLAYAIRQRDIVFVIGQATGILIYARNIYLSRPQAKLPEPA
jgi:lipid-A-disaccharide synthase-like uncharacterized protein